MYVRSSKNLEITPFLKDEPSSVHSDSLSLFEVCLQFGLQIRLQKGRDHPGLRCLKFQPLIGNLQTIPMFKIHNPDYLFQSLIGNLQTKRAAEAFAQPT
jgi:hypothetical protein